MSVAVMQEGVDKYADTSDDRREASLPFAAIHMTDLSHSAPALWLHAAVYIFICASVKRGTDTGSNRSVGSSSSSPLVVAAETQDVPHSLYPQFENNAIKQICKYYLFLTYNKWREDINMWIEPKTLAGH